MKKNLPGKEEGRWRNQVLVGGLKQSVKRERIENWDSKRRIWRCKKGLSCKTLDSLTLVYYPYYKKKKYENNPNI